MFNDLWNMLTGQTPERDAYADQYGKNAKALDAYRGVDARSRMAAMQHGMKPFEKTNDLLGQMYGEDAKVDMAALANPTFRTPTDASTPNPATVFQDPVTRENYQEQSFVDMLVGGGDRAVDSMGLSQQNAMDAIREALGYGGNVGSVPEDMYRQMRSQGLNDEQITSYFRSR